MSRLMKDAVRADWVSACDGDEMDMANWAIKWGNPLMAALDRRVLDDRLVEAANIQDRLVEALEETLRLTLQILSENSVRNADEVISRTEALLKEIKGE